MARFAIASAVLIFGLMTMLIVFAYVPGLDLSTQVAVGSVIGVVVALLLYWLAKKTQPQKAVAVAMTPWIETNNPMIRPKRAGHHAMVAAISKAGVIVYTVVVIIAGNFFLLASNALLTYIDYLYGQKRNSIFAATLISIGILTAMLIVIWPYIKSFFLRIAALVLIAASLSQSLYTNYMFHQSEIYADKEAQTNITGRYEKKAKRCAELDGSVLKAIGEYNNTVQYASTKAKTVETLQGIADTCEQELAEISKDLSTEGTYGYKTLYELTGISEGKITSYSTFFISSLNILMVFFLMAIVVNCFVDSPNKKQLPLNPTSPPGPPEGRRRRKTKLFTSLTEKLARALAPKSQGTQRLTVANQVQPKRKHIDKTGSPNKPAHTKRLPAKKRTPIKERDYLKVVDMILNKQVKPGQQGVIEALGGGASDSYSKYLNRAVKEGYLTKIKRNKNSWSWRLNTTGLERMVSQGKLKKTDMGYRRVPQLKVVS